MPKSKEPKKTVCELTGHSYRTTTSALYRVCDYPSCKHAQRFVDGQWVDVAPKEKPQQKPQEPTYITSVWDECDHIGVRIHYEKPVKLTSVQTYWQDGR